MIFCVTRRFLSDIKLRKQQSKMYDMWRTETLNTYLQHNSKLDINGHCSREILRHKSVPDKLIYMSKYEQLMLDKIKNARFIIKKCNAIFIANEIQFINDYNMEHKDYTTISYQLRSRMKEEVSRDFSSFFGGKLF